MASLVEAQIKAALAANSRGEKYEGGIMLKLKTPYADELAADFKKLKNHFAE